MKRRKMLKPSVARQPGFSTAPQGGLTDGSDTASLGMNVEGSASDAPLGRTLSGRRFTGKLSIAGKRDFDVA